MAAPVLGLDAKLYRNTGTYGSPTWNEIPNVKDLTLTMEKGEHEISTRASTWKQYAGTLKDASIGFQMVWDTSDADFEAIRDAFLNNTQLDMLCLDGAQGTAGSEGLRANMIVTGFTRTENLEESLMVDVTMKPGYNANPPSWYTAS